MSDLLSLSGQTACMSSAGLAEGTNAATIQIAAPNGAGIDYVINGIAYHKADTDNIAVTAADAQAVLTSCLYLVQIDSAGTVSTVKGTAALNADVGVTASLQWPYPDADNCPIGGYKVTCTNAATFTNGTTDMSAADVAVDFFNFGLGMPASPEITVAS